MLIVIDLRVDIHDNDQVVLGVIADGNADNILPVNVNNMLDDLRLLLKPICPYCFLLGKIKLVQHLLLKLHIYL